MKYVRKLALLAMAVASFSVVGVNAQNYSNSQTSTKSVEQQIYKKLLGLPNYGVFDIIKYQVNGGTVTLTGKVNSLGTKSAAANVVKRTPGVTEVVNTIDELPPSSFDDAIRRQALRTFARYSLSGYLWENNPDVRIIVENGRLTLEGNVMNSGDYNLFYITARGINNVFQVTNNLVVGKARDS
ncbi:MAG: BON domain-containing protein [Acidobacteria bacterium]|nr:BON domain-containing protein [Acidobacteriota bacterium]